MGFYTNGLFTIISFQPLALEQHEKTINTKVYHNSDSQHLEFTIPILQPRLIECYSLYPQHVNTRGPLQLCGDLLAELNDSSLDHPMSPNRLSA